MLPGTHTSLGLYPDGTGSPWIFLNWWTRMPLRGQLPPITSTTSRPAALTHPPSNALVGALEYRTETEVVVVD